MVILLQAVTALASVALKGYETVQKEGLIDEQNSTLLGLEDSNNEIMEELDIHTPILNPHNI